MAKPFILPKSSEDLVGIEKDAAELIMESKKVLGLADAFKRLGPRFRDVVQKVSGFISGLSHLDVNELHPINPRSAMMASKGMDYMAMRRHPVWVPKGMSSTYYELILTLSVSANALSQLIPGLLKPFNEQLSFVLTDPDLLKGQNSNVFKHIAFISLDKQKEDIQKHFGKHNTEARNLGDVLQSANMLPKTTEAFNRLSDQVMSIDVDVVEELSIDISSKLTLLLDRIKEDEEGYAMSGLTYSEIARVSYQLAEHVEFYVQFVTLVEQVNVGLEQLISVVQEAQQAA